MSISPCLSTSVNTTCDKSAMLVFGRILHRAWDSCTSGLQDRRWLPLDFCVLLGRTFTSKCTVCWEGTYSENNKLVFYWPFKSFLFMKTQSCSRILWLLTLQNPIGTQFVSGRGTWSVLYELSGKAWVNVDRLFCHIMSHYRLYKLLFSKKNFLVFDGNRKNIYAIKGN